MEDAHSFSSAVPHFGLAAISVLVQREWDKRLCSLRESEQHKNCKWIHRFGANPGAGIRAASCRPSGLGPGSALRSRPRVALSSAQALSGYIAAA